MVGIHEFSPYKLVHTPHGEGQAMLLFDYGLTTNSVWVVRLRGGEPRHYFSPDVRVLGNPMDGHGWDVEIPKGWKK